MTENKNFYLNQESIRQTVLDYICNMPLGFMIHIKPKTRSLDQNAMFHALCDNLEKSGLTWANKQRSAMEWKVLLVSGHAIATQQPTEVMFGLEGELINLRESTAKMSKARASSLMDYALAFCAANGIETIHEKNFEI